jgi:uncharacterized membrane protein YgcG
MDALELLRRQHGEVIELFGRLRAATEDGSSPGRIRDELILALRAHAQLEEQLFYPRFEGLDETADLVQEAFHEHEEIEDVLAELAGCALDDDEFPAIVAELEGMVIQHLGDEEDALFPEVAEAMSEEALGGLGREMEARYRAIRAELAGTPTGGSRGGRGGGGGGRGGGRHGGGGGRGAGRGRDEAPGHPPDA